MTTTRRTTKCDCGCGDATLGGRFRPGHDAKLKSRLLQQARGTNKRTATKARAELKRLGWLHFLKPRAAT
jgi:hypothetical protein